ncbi:hypothetical protein NDU88_007140 [Pleurodeles waltl]|uniref:Uncharacterized protein n=1 Tax=Pleurodeles waltl TaxID=8319 RepID=A0AAV7SRN7_PLEWA|nr:hypothetical protein NDU88_007140 [Pleurodeles waltl]
MCDNFALSPAPSRRGDSSSQCQAGPRLSARGGVAAYSRASLSCLASVLLAPASSRGPGRNPTVRFPAGERSHSPAQTRGSQRRWASARSWRRCARSSVPRGGSNPCAAAARGEMPWQYAQGATLWPGATSVLNASLGSRATQPGHGQVGGCAAAQTPQPRLHSDFTGDSDGAATMPCVHCTYLSQASLFSGSSRRPRLTPSHSSDQLGTSCHGSKPLGPPPGRGGGSHHIVVPARDQDKRTKGGP